MLLLNISDQNMSLFIQLKFLQLFKSSKLNQSLNTESISLNKLSQDQFQLIKYSNVLLNIVD